MSRTQTETFELQAPSTSQPTVSEKGFVQSISQRLRKESSSQNDQHDNLGDGTRSSAASGLSEVSPEDAAGATVAKELERWNFPKGNAFRIFAAFWAFMVMGMNDAAYGPVIPYLEDYYHLSYTIVSLIFLAPCVGYWSSAVMLHALHMRFGQRGIGFFAAFCKILAYIVVCTHPPYPVLVVMYLLADLGNGLQDGAWNAWTGGMANANEILGLLHAMYGLGATLSPFIATTMITKLNLPWYNFYYFMLGVATIECILATSAFWSRTGAVFRATQQDTTHNASDTADATPRANGGTSRMRESLFTYPAARVTWLCALFLFCYVGAEVAIGGWVVTFMLEVRKGTRFASGMTATGFWLGITVGRVVLGFVTPRMGEKLAISIYILVALALSLLFWLIPSFLTSAIFISLQGFFLGPLFPAAIVAATKLLPLHLHVSAVGFAAAAAGSGGAVFPFAVGAVAQKVGVKALQPMIVGILVVTWGLWVALPRLPRRKE